MRGSTVEAQKRTEALLFWDTFSQALPAAQAHTSPRLNQYRRPLRLNWDCNSAFRWTSWRKEALQAIRDRPRASTAAFHGHQQRSHQRRKCLSCCKKCLPINKMSLLPELARLQNSAESCSLPGRLLESLPMLPCWMQDQQTVAAIAIIRLCEPQLVIEADPSTRLLLPQTSSALTLTPDMQTTLGRSIRQLIPYIGSG